MKFKAEIAARDRAREKLIKKLKEKLGNDDKLEPWRPSGLIAPCTGCGHTFAEKVGTRRGGDGGTKGLCNQCDLKQRNALREGRFLEKAKAAYEKRKDRMEKGRKK